MILDDVIAALPESGRKLLTEDTKKAPFVKIDNVVEYYYAGTDQEYWDLAEDFPNCAPPWPVCWMEWKMPAKMLSGDTSASSYLESLGFTKQGPYLIMPRLGRMAHGCLIHAKEVSSPELPEIRWTLAVHCFMPDFPGSWLGTVYMAVKSDGRLYVLESDDPRCRDVGALFGFTPAQVDDSIRSAKAATNREVAEYRRRVGQSATAFGLKEDKYFVPVITGSRTTDGMIAHMGTGIRNLALLAFSFCHCRNVKLDKNEVPPKLLKKRVSSGKLPISRFYTLQIEPMKKILRTEGRSDEVGLRRALHMMRGHFKHFEEGSGLFGKYHGTYWWNQAVRGTAKKGEVRKDYSVKP